MKKTLGAFIPLLCLLLLGVVLWKGTLNPDLQDSPLINKSLPRFQLAVLENDKQFHTEKVLYGKLCLLHVWASWCEPCQEEHEMLKNIKEVSDIPIIGVLYHDDKKSALEWLKKRGNPYQMNLLDKEGAFGLALGVYGTPETFIVDKKGRLRYHHIGVITEEVWAKTLFPLIQTLEK